MTIKEELIDYANRCLAGEEISGESTTPLFRKLAAVSYLEGELDASVSYDVPVIASVIQEQDGSKTMKEIYQEYLKQADIDQKEARG